jgi:hypothetical protein
MGGYERRRGHENGRTAVSGLPEGLRDWWERSERSEMGRDDEKEKTMTKTHARLAMAVLGIAALLVLATPGIAQQVQSGQSVVSGSSDAGNLGALQRRFSGGALSANAAGLNAVSEGAGTTLSCSECLCLDTYDPTHTDNAPAGNPWVLGPVHTAGILQNGAMYLITVSGDVSYWYQSVWSGTTIVGTPGNIRYPSDGQCDSSGTHGLSGFDWEYLFAFPGTSETVPQHLPADVTSLDGGVTYYDPVPLGGQAYSSSHVYQYIVFGQGKQAYFRVTDSGPTSDNWGKYKICIQHLTACGSNGCDGGSD